MPQHLRHRIIPLRYKGRRELRNLLRRRLVAAPHCWLRRLVAGVVLHELTKLNQHAVFNWENWGTDSVWILLRTSQHRFQERLDAGSE